VNTGSGGGGGNFTANAANGGSGVVILSYPNTFQLTGGAGLTFSTAAVGANHVTTFTAGTGTIQLVPAQQAFVLLESVVLTSSQASVEFTNLVSKYADNYQHLQIRASFAGNNTNNSPAIFFNGITTGSYAWHFLNGDGSTVASGASASDANIFIGQGGTSSNTDIFGAHVIDILDPFETTKNTTTRTLSGLMAPGYLNAIYLNSGVFLNTAAVNSITFTDRLGRAYTAKSRFSLYGIRGS
jgi:hypothetical protein